MNRRAFTLSLIVAAIAMMMIYTYIDGVESEYNSRYGIVVSVVVAKKDINELEVIDSSKVGYTEIPKNFVAPGAFLKTEETNNLIALTPILKGEQITRPRLTAPGSRTGLARQISVGKRAISISVSDDQAVSKLIKPGDRVDIIALIDYAGGKKELLKVNTVLQDVLVLSTGMSITNSLPLALLAGDEESRGSTIKFNRYVNYGTITLELDPYQIQKIVFLERIGARLSLSLRNNDDKQIVRIQGSRLFDLLGDDAVEAKAFFAAEKEKGKVR